MQEEAVAAAAEVAAIAANAPFKAAMTASEKDAFEAVIMLDVFVEIF